MRTNSKLTTYSLKLSTLERFEKYAENRSINKSAFVDKAICKELDIVEKTEKPDEILGESIFSNLAIKIYLEYHDNGSRAWTRFKFINITNNRNTGMYNFYHPKYLLNDWNNLKGSKNFSDLNIFKDKNNLRMWMLGEKDTIVDINNKDEIKSIDKFINKILSEYLQKIKDNPDFEKQFKG